VGAHSRKQHRTRRSAVIVAVGAMVATAGITIGAQEIGWRSAKTAGEGKGTQHPTPATLTGATGPSGPTAAWVQQENAKPGTDAWRLTGKQKQGAIEGFFDHISAVQGDTVELYVSTVAPTFHVELYRMGFYSGKGGRLVWRSDETPGQAQPKATVEPVVNMVEAPWTPSLAVHIDKSWNQGVYIAKLVGSGGQQQYAIFTLRDDNSHATFAVKNSVTSWQAYNLWGGYDLYAGKAGRGSDFAHRARIVSFDRPYLIGDGSGDFLGNEFPLVSLMESAGLDITYLTDVDFHGHPERMLNHRALLSLGHDEYWSTSMFDGALAARDHGVNIAFFGANAVFRHIRMSPSPLGHDRQEIDYKSAREDPLHGKNNAEVTVDWREPPNNRPESTLIGEYYECNPVKNDFVVTEPSAWIYKDTGLAFGDRIGGLVGSEYDHWDSHAPGPRNVEVMAHSPVNCRGHRSTSDMTWYTAASGAGVWDSGTNLWIPFLGNDKVKKMTENLLLALGSGRAGSDHPSVSNTAHLVTPTTTTTIHRRTPPTTAKPPFLIVASSTTSTTRHTFPTVTTTTTTTKPRRTTTTLHR
jgi:hypothetical protein